MHVVIRGIDYLRSSIDISGLWKRRLGENQVLFTIKRGSSIPIGLRLAASSSLLSAHRLSVAALLFGELPARRVYPASEFSETSLLLTVLCMKLHSKSRSTGGLKS